MGEFRVCRGNFKSKILLRLWTNIYAQNIQMRFKRILLKLQGPLQISRRRQSSQILGWDRQWRTLIPEKLEIRQKVLNRGPHEVTCPRRLIVRHKMRRCFLRISIRQRWRGMPLPSTPWNHRFLFFFLLPKRISSSLSSFPILLRSVEGKDFAVSFAFSVRLCHVWWLFWFSSGVKFFFFVCFFCD